MANQLIHEQSPYLLQHAHNPVNWYPWGPAAFERAAAENKPVLISIGYAACHWCHVMERESFEDAATAAYMNEHFINIKVDREEYPDVDDFYMSAVQTLTGSGGWPLNVFVRPDKLPFYGGTYFPPQAAYGRPSWLQLLTRMQEVWLQNRDSVDQQAEQMMSHLQNAAQQATVNMDAGWHKEELQQSRNMLLQYADKTNGGFGRAPKFPATMAIAFLLEYAHYNNDELALRHALHSLDAMMEGGIYDQLGGGFARYATDDHWLVPHFEKMLYDNALLTGVYCDAYACTGNEKYRKIVEETIGFVLRELKGDGPGFYSALDADSEGVEGKFYTWDYEQWKAAAKELDPLVGAYFGVSEEGNWEHTNILHVARSVESLSAASGRDPATIQQHIDQAKKHLFTLRKNRIRPGTDDKCLLSWNALMNIALTRAYVVLDDEKYLEEALVHMRWMLETYQSEAKLMHAWKSGPARIGANLDDYAYLVQSLLQMASVTGDLSWLEPAEKLTHTVLQYFSEDGVLLLHFTSSQENNIPFRKPETYDGVTPSSNAVMAQNLYQLGMLAEQSAWVDRAEAMLLQMKDTARRHPTSFAYWNMIAQRELAGMKTVEVRGGTNAKAILAQLRRHMAPHCFYFGDFGKKTENSVTMPEQEREDTGSMIFICNKSSCLAPVAANLKKLDFAIF